MSPATRKQAFSELSLEVFRLTARLNLLGDRLARRAGLSNARWQVLSAVAAAPGPESVADIARRMGLQRQSVQRTADNLEAQGFLSYMPNPNHQRAKLVTLTASGEEALNTLHDLRDSWADEIKHHLNLTKLTQATETLTDLRKLLDQDEHGTA